MILGSRDRAREARSGALSIVNHMMFSRQRAPLSRSQLPGISLVLLNIRPDSNGAAYKYGSHAKPQRRKEVKDLYRFNQLVQPIPPICVSLFHSDGRPFTTREMPSPIISSPKLIMSPSRQFVSLR
jgi:hypothetical protein